MSNAEYRVVVLIGKEGAKHHFAQLETTTNSDDLTQIPLDIQEAVEQYEYDCEEREGVEGEDERTSDLD